jgi:phosphoenolpyruvate synthase/pyruvate phosphate dikinase
MFDDKCKLMYSDPVECDLTGNTEVFNQIKEAVKNALIIEKEFGCRQDIEGGFDEKGRLYLWQTRNIP